MIDIHCHILPEIDDGPRDMATSVDMAKIAAEDGITAIVATPHIKNNIHPPAVITEYVNSLNRELANQGVPLTILQGADVYALLDPSIMAPYTINGTKYILIEFPHSHLPRNTNEILFRLLAAGLQPIITHPERNPTVLGNPNALIDLVDSNILVQITADSITGSFGSEIQQCAAYLLRKGVVDILATDAHSTEHRKPVLSCALKETAKIIGADRAQMLVSANPEAVVSGKPLAQASD